MEMYAKAHRQAALETLLIPGKGSAGKRVGFLANSLYLWLPIQEEVCAREYGQCCQT